MRTRNTTRLILYSVAIGVVLLAVMLSVRARLGANSRYEAAVQSVGLFVAAVFFGLIMLWPLLAVAAVPLVVRQWFGRTMRGRRTRLGLCPSCGYDRRGLDPTTPCPECGTIPDLK
jgi:hypothetical protein